MAIFHDPREQIPPFDKKSALDGLTAEELDKTQIPGK